MTHLNRIKQQSESLKRDHPLSTAQRKLSHKGPKGPLEYRTLQFCKETRTFSRKNFTDRQRPSRKEPK